MKQLNQFLLALLLLGAGLSSKAQTQSDSNTYWPAIKQEAKPWTRWWWLGSAVDKPNIDRLVKEYAAKGIGGVEITPVYGVKGDEANYIDFLSPEWVAMLKETVEAGNSNGLGVDMNTGTGWPFGGPMVTDEYAAKKMLFHQLGELTNDEVKHYVETVKGSETEELIALSAYNDANQRVDLLNEGSSLDDISAFHRQVIAITETNTGQKVKRAAPGGEGLVFNHFSKKATDHYLETFDAAFNGNPGVRGFFNDSYELESANAASELFGTFKALKGYDLALYAKELSGEGDEDTIARIKADYRDVLGDMLLHNFTQTWTNWAHSYNAITRNQAHGSPGNLIDLYAAVGIPEMETFNSTNFPFLQDFIDNSDAKHTESNKLFKKFASSAAHMKGEKLVSCETFTWLNEHFKTPLYQCKAELDELFVKGVTHLFFHGTAYSPERAGWPGWCFYASVHMDPNNPQWEHIDAMNAYIARCQSVLQQGQHTNDFLVFWSPDDYNTDARALDKKLTLHNSESWVNMPEIEKLLDKGYLFDFVTDRIIADAKVDGKNVLTFGKVPYKAIVLPGIERIKPETFKKLLQLAEDGATIIFSNLPDEVTGFKDYEEQEAEMAELVAGLNFEDNGQFQVAATGKGAIYLGDAEAALADDGITRETLVDHHIKSISRKTDSGYYYFIANHEKEAVNDWLPFKYFAKNALFMNPMDGSLAVAETDGNKVNVHLRPGESMIVYFTDDDLTGVPAYQSLAEGNTTVLANEWKLKALSGGPELFPAATMTEPTFWTDLQGDAYQNFSGSAEYSTIFKMNKPKAANYLLRLDKVEASVKVFVNDKEVGTLWSFPFELEVGSYLKKGENTLRLEVCNLAGNRIRYMDRAGIEWKIFNNINIVNLDYRPLDATNWKVLPSGISGKVKLIEQNAK